jgi:hypothetical protein
MSQFYEGNCSHCGKYEVGLIWSDRHKMILCNACYYYGNELPPKCECCGQVIHKKKEDKHV